MSRKNILIQVIIVIIALGAIIGCSLNEPSDDAKIPATNVGEVDKISCAQIQNLDVDRDGNDFTIVFDTPCAAFGGVAWGYAPDALDNPVLGTSGTHHVLEFTVDGSEGCVYFEVTAVESGTYPPSSDSSGLLTSFKDIVITNINRTVDPLACTMTVTWNTNVKASSTLNWGTTCGTLTNVDTGAGNTKYHSVTVDIVGVSSKSRIYSQPESENLCDSALGACGFVYKYYCIR